MVSEVNLEKMILSLIIPIFNAGQFLEECLKSLISINLQGIEIICVNDGSTDNSAQILENFKQKDHRIIVINQENQGVSVARNNAIAISKGKYLGFVDADDFVSSDFFQNMVEKAEETKAEIVVSDFLFENDGKFVRDNSTFTKNKLLNKTEIQHAIFPQLVKSDVLNSVCNKIFSAELIRKNDISFPAGITNGEDGDFVRKAVSKAKNMVFADIAGYHYRKTEGSASRNILNKNFLKIALEHYRDGFNELQPALPKEVIEKYKSVRLANNLMALVSLIFQSPLKFKDKISKTKEIVNSEELQRVFREYSPEIFQNQGRFSKFLLKNMQKRNVFLIATACKYANSRNKKMKKDIKVLLFMHSGSLNRGCEALARTAVKVVKGNFPNSEISIASYAPETDIALPNVKEVFDMSAKEIPPKSLDYFSSAIAVKLFGDENIGIRKANKTLLKKIPQYDLFLSIGGDAYCYGEQPSWYELNRQIKKAGKKMVLWGCSIGLEDLSAPKIEDLKNFDLILARESLTENLLKSKGLNQTKLVADGAFLLDKEELPLPENWLEGKMVGMNFSPLVYKRNTAAKEAFENLVRHILETTDLRIAFTPHVTIKDNDDYEILQEIFKKFELTGRVLLLPNNLNALQYKGFIARMKFFIGARTHATIAGYSNGVPIMVLGYSVKSKGIAKDLFGEERLVLGIEEISDSEKLILKFEEMKADEGEIREILKNKLPQIKERAKNAGSYLVGLFR